MILAPISLGELVDKITILKLKKEKVESPEQRHNIVNELDRLNAIYEKQEGYAARHMVNLYLELLEVNTEIWDIEEEMRVIMYNTDNNSAYEDIKEGYKFAQLSEKTHRLNDRRAHIKRQINTEFNSTIIEEKIYKGSDPWKTQQ